MQQRRLQLPLLLLLLLLLLLPMAMAMATVRGAATCADGALDFVDAKDYSGCKAESGFTLVGADEIDLTAFCKSDHCEALVDQLRRSDGLGCLDVAGMEGIVATTDDGTTSVSCSAFVEQVMVPSGTYGVCTAAMRHDLRTSDYRDCYNASGFVLNPSSSSSALDLPAFCKSYSCLRVFNELQTSGGTECFSASNAAAFTTETDDGMGIDCSSVEDAVEFALLPAGDFESCTAEMRREVQPDTYRSCRSFAQFTFDGSNSSAVDVASFCSLVTCRRVYDQLQAANGSLCINIPGLENVVSLSEDGDMAIVDCSSQGGTGSTSGEGGDNVSQGLDFTALPTGDLGACTESKRARVTEYNYRSCHEDAGFSFNGSVTQMTAFCGSEYCRAMFDELQVLDGSICLAVDNMVVETSGSGNGVKVLCPSDRGFALIPSTGQCTEEMRAKMEAINYRRCQRDSNFTFDGALTTNASAFCHSTSCEQMYDALVLGNGTSCMQVDGLVDLQAGLALKMHRSEADGSWCTQVATAVKGGNDNGAVLSTGAVVGIIVGVVLALALALALWMRQRRNRAKDASKRTNASTLQGTDVPTTGHGGDGGLYHSADSPLQHGGLAGAGSKKSTGSYPSMPSTGSNSLWEDQVIVAARIPYEKLVWGKLLGRGGYGEVYSGFYRDEAVAIKRLPREQRYGMQQIESLLAEVKLMAGMDHPRIVALIGVAWDALTELCIVSELMPRGDLRALLRLFAESEDERERRPRGFDMDKVRIALHVAHALTYLHSLQPVMLHRDLKSRNILLDDELNAKVTDFGVSRLREEHTMTAGVGSALWMAPEVMAGGHYDEKADIFSFGIVLSELDTHALPYSDATEPGTRRRLAEPVILQRMASGRLQVSFTESCEDSAMAALGRDCVAVDPADRPNTAEVLHRVHQAMQTMQRQALEVEPKSEHGSE